MTDDQDLLQQIASAGARLDPGLSDRDVERLVEGGRRRRRGRTLRRTGLLASALGTGLVAAVLVAHHSPHPSPALVGAPHSPAVEPGRVAAPPLLLADGSRATPLEAGSEIEIVEQSPARVRLSLARGRGRFEVTPRSERVLSVQAGDVTVTVLGTIFTVERIADRVGVVVERGTVRVDWEGAARALRAGESGWFPPLLLGAPSTPKPVPVPPARPAKARAPSEVRAAEPAPVPERKPESAEDLLLAADGARLTGDGERGAELLRRLLREHRFDPRAPLAAFTLGRVLLMELGRPREAAAAFAEVRQLAPGGSFAEDALAREVEAWHQAGRADAARARAQEYLRLYPSGRRAAAVRSLGGLE